MAAVGDILRATMVGVTLEAQVFNSVYHYRVGAGTETDYDVIALAIVAAWDTAYALIESKIHADTDSAELELSQWDTVNKEFDGKATVVCLSLAGSDVADPLPGGNALVVRFITEELRRQGRKFIPGMIESQNSGNNLSAGLVVDLILFAASINNFITAGGVTLVPCTFNSTVGSPRFDTHSLFTDTAFVNTKSGYQRRRQVGAGV